MPGPHFVKRGLRPRSDREAIWEPDSSDLLACVRTHSDAERLGKGGAGRWVRASTSWMAVTGFPKRQLVGEDIDSCEAPLDDSREPRFPVMDAVGPNHGGGLH